jgi:feruloyl esterase
LVTTARKQHSWQQPPIRRMIHIVALLALSLVGAPASAKSTLPSPYKKSFQDKCTSLVLDNFPNVNWGTPTFIKQGTILNLTEQFPDKTCLLYDGINPQIRNNICRLQVNVATSKTSAVTLEVWLPEDWSGRFLSTGNGGFAGCKFTHFYSHCLLSINESNAIKRHRIQ